MKKPLIEATDEVRELPEGFFPKATRGRPPMPEADRKQRVSVMLDPDILARLKAGGKGWQTRLNAMLREALGM